MYLVTRFCDDKKPEERGFNWGVTVPSVGAVTGAKSKMEKENKFRDQIDRASSMRFVNKRFDPSLVALFAFASRMRCSWLVV